MKRKRTQQPQQYVFGLGSVYDSLCFFKKIGARIPILGQIHQLTKAGKIIA
jgi:arginine exporter protein ArgO